MKTAGERRISGWHQAQERFAAGSFGCDAPKVTKWEKLLRELAVGEDQALAAVRSCNGVGTTIRAFVRKVFLRRYVPEAVLEEMGLLYDVENARCLTTRMSEDGD